MRFVSRREWRYPARLIGTCNSRVTSYGAAMVGVATAKTPCGPYTYKGSWKPLGADSRDESVFQDSKFHTS